MGTARCPNTTARASVPRSRARAASAKPRFIEVPQQRAGLSGCRRGQEQARAVAGSGAVLTAPRDANSD
eukprot:8795437-Lingulodinium_polyedra.AAC.1